jgi:high-affinity iron transporter
VPQRALLVLVLFVMVGEEVNEMQLAGWIPTTPIAGITFPGWAGPGSRLFANRQTVIAQIGALVRVLGSYVAAEYVRVWRPRRRGRKEGHLPEAPPGELVKI